jgi:hypothetical protein
MDKGLERRIASMKKIVKPSYSVQEYEMEKAQTFEKSGYEVGPTSLQAAVALQKVFRVLPGC